MREARGNAVRRALLVVDVQEGLVKKSLYEKKRFLSTIGGAIAGFRKAGEMIVFVRHDGAIVKRGSPEWELYPGLDPRADDPVVDKHRGNAFEDTGLTDLLAGRGINRVVVCGLVSHGCVRAAGIETLGIDLLWERGPLDGLSPGFFRDEPGRPKG